jgi:hypothetical protein
MRRLVFLIISVVATLIASAQMVPVTIEQQLENLSESDEAQLENDQYLQDLRYFRQHPFDINSATTDDWHLFRFLTDLQIQNFIQYRKTLGKFISIYELQSVPGWDPVTLRRLAPYLMVNTTPDIESLKKRLREGEHTLLLRETRILEDRKGYAAKISNGYLGSPDHLQLRYRYQYRNLLRYGFTADKDAGEAFGKGAQKLGFDFYSAHFFAQDLGIVKALALGDFTVNMGQGLVQWQSLSFKKSAEATAIKRQGAVLQPYGSMGEFNFNRGAGVTLKRKSLEVALFGSVRKLSANLVSDPINNGVGISGLLTSGLHRTAAEGSDKNTVQQTSFGGTIRFSHNTLQVGINALAYQFAKPLLQKSQPYNKYEITGQQWSNYSLDYSYTYRNLHLFGEGAIDRRGAKAFVNGLLLSADAKVDVALLYRHIDANYRSLYGNAFTESALPENEKGVYAGITVRPSATWKLDAYADFYNFPWLKFRVDAPSRGQDYLVQATYLPNKQFELYTRYKVERKPINKAQDSATHAVINKPRQNWRLHFTYAVSPMLTVKARTEIIWHNKKAEDAEAGFLAFMEAAVKPARRFSANLRLQYFETEGFNSRIYAYESDVLYGYSIPAFSDRGYRYYLNVAYDITKKLGVWLRLAQTVYKDRKTIGSGLEEINGNRKTEIKLQGIYIF